MPVILCLRTHTKCNFDRLFALIENSESQSRHTMPHGVCFGSAVALVIWGQSIDDYRHTFRDMNVNQAVISAMSPSTVPNAVFARSVQHLRAGSLGAQAPLTLDAVVDSSKTNVGEAELLKFGFDITEKSVHLCAPPFSPKGGRLTAAAAAVGGGACDARRCCLDHHRPR